MAAPVTGPYYYEELFPATGPKAGKEMHLRRWWYRQKRPYTDVLNFDYTKGKVTGTVNREPDLLEVSVLPDPNVRIAAQAIARDKFTGKVQGVRSSIGALYAQRQQAVNMIEKRATQLFNFVKAVRRMDFPAAARAIGQRRLTNRRGQPITRQNIRDSAGVVLETAFGWVPLASDIYNAAQFLSDGIPPQRVSARGDLLSTASWSPGLNYTRTIKSSTWTKVGACVRVDNPNLHLAESLGMLNPAAILAEITPWSFVVNYFITLDEFVGSLTEFYGLSLTRQYSTSLQRVDQRLVYFNQPISHYWEVEGYRIQAKRVSGLPSGPTLKLRDPWVLKTQRAATSAALLAQQIKEPPRIYPRPPRRRTHVFDNFVEF